ncbi:squalene/phytoene synthase family protein [Sphingorhabdus arenilitoris]|uniref:Squalene/phytoene synthase family protein n=1 Tax=Sphingorhabdus arenilitoris TaxID=1490041 RepID=A0ABV8RF83_9SPHN
MKLDINALKPPKRLAVAYAPRDAKAALTLLLLFDERLGQILERTSEPLIGQMRLAWWRDIIGKEAEARPSGEPLIALLNDVNLPLINDAMLNILSGWEELIAAEQWDEMTLRRHATHRATGLFEGYAKLFGGPYDETQLIEAGARWALADCLHYCRDQQQHDAVTAWILDSSKMKLPRHLRPLSILTKSAGDHISGFALLWHALTGR